MTDDFQLPAGTSIGEGRYTVVRALGRGSFGRTFLVDDHER